MKILVSLLCAASTLTWPYQGRAATEAGDSGPSSAWVGPDGDWGFTGHVSNRSGLCHAYKYRVRFKKAGVVFFTGETSSIKLCGQHSEGDVSGAGRGVEALRENFAEIDSSDSVLVE